MEERPGFLLIEVAGRGWENEAGGHRWQEYSGAGVHTSTVTVAVLPAPSQQDMPKFRDGDLEITTTKDSGPGGQHKNKTESCVVIKHIPTGLVVKASSERSQAQNKESALNVLRARVWEQRMARDSKNRNRARSQQIGTGERGDKMRTYRVRDNIITTRSGAKISLSAVMAGGLEQIWGVD